MAKRQCCAAKIFANGDPFYVLIQRPKPSRGDDLGRADPVPAPKTASIGGNPGRDYTWALPSPALRVTRPYGAGAYKLSVAPGS